MAASNSSWKQTASLIIWAIAAVWIALSLWNNALGGVLGGLTFGAIASLLLAGFSSGDVKKL